MPIKLKAPSFTSPGEDLSIDFQAIDANGEPIANAEYTASRQFNSMVFSNPVTSDIQIKSTTAEDGSGSFKLYANLPSGAFNAITISAGVALDRLPVGVFSPSTAPNVVVEGGYYENGDIVVDNDSIISDGLKLMVTLPVVAQKDETIFLCIGSYFTYTIVDSPKTTATFRLPSGFSGSHPLNNDNSLFYGLIKSSGNCVVPNLTKITVKGAVPSLNLLQPSVVSIGGEYINTLANLIGVTLSIPANQSDINKDDGYRFVYSTNEDLSDFKEIQSGKIEDSSEPTTINTEQNFFPQINNTPAWFWYIITDSNGISHASRLTSRIIDTM